MDEFLRLSLVKSFVTLLPKRLKYRVSKVLYNYNSKKIKGINIVVPYDNSLFFFLNTKEFIGWNIFFHKNYEEDTNAIIKKYISPDDIVIEAGANNGSESLIIGKILSKGNGKLYAFEPAPIPYKNLIINILLNGLENTVLYFDLLLGEKESSEDFFLTPENAANQGKGSRFEFAESQFKITKRQITIDKFVEEYKLSRLDFIKMDIQGSEIDLIKGATNSIIQFRPIIFTEASNSELKRRNSDITEFFNILIELNYEVNNIHESSIHTIRSPKDILEGNWLAIPK